MCKSIRLIFRYLRDSLHFVDKRRVAVWGWSYGGFVAALALAHPEQDVFQCGISVAPVVSWKLYGKRGSSTMSMITCHISAYFRFGVRGKVHGVAERYIEFQRIRGIGRI